MAPKFDVIGVVVDDMAKAVAFYRELGLEFADDAETQPHTEAELPGGLRLALDSVETIRSFHPEWQAPSGDGRVGLAFQCDSPADVDATYERLTKAGYTGRKEPWDAFWNQRYALVADPDGNGIDLFAPLD